jgi:hypothetical protein
VAACSVRRRSLDDIWPLGESTVVHERGLKPTITSDP